LVHLPLTINGFWLHVNILIKGYMFQCLDKLFYHLVIVCASVVVCLNEMCHMLFRVTVSIKLLEFWRVAIRHAEHINPLSIRLGIEVSLVSTFTKLYLDCIRNKVLDLLDGHYA